MSRSGSGKADPDLEGVELLFHQRGGSDSFIFLVQLKHSSFWSSADVKLLQNNYKHL